MVAVGRPILVLLVAVALAVGAAGLYWSGDLPGGGRGVAAAATHPGHQLVPEVISNVTAGDGASLAGVRGLDVFAADAGLYVVAAASSGDAVLVINVTDPYDPRVISSIVDDGSTALGGASAVDVIRIGSGTYAVVASANDDGLQVINLTNPADPVPVASLTDDGRVALAGAYDVDTFAVGLGTYAVVASASDDGLQVINLTRPADPVPVASLTDNQTAALDGAVAVDAIRIGSGTYAVVASPNDDGLQIVNLTRPADPVPVAGLADNGTVHLGGARGVAALDRGLGTYAVVASDDGLQVVEVTDPADPVPVSRIPDDSVNATLRNASAVDTFMMDGGAYAMVATADGIVVVDLADPAGPVPVGVAQNDPALRGASALKAFHVAGHAYAAVAVPDGGGAIRIVSLGEMDTVPPALSSAAWMPANRTIVMVFSEPLEHAATIYPEMTILGESANLTLADVSSRTAAGGTIEATLSLAQEAALGVPEAVQLSEGAVRDVSGNPVPPTSLAVTLDDLVPPAISSAIYELGTGLLTISFSEPLNHTATIYRDIAVAGPVHRYTLEEISVGTALGTTIEATLDAAQVEAVGSAPVLYVVEGAVRDIWDNPIGLVDGLAVTVLDPGDAPVLVSSSYDTGTGVLNITFSEPLNATTIHYDRIAVRDAGQSSGGLILDSVTSRTLDADSATTMTLTLSTAQRQMINDMATPQLDIGAGAVADAAGNGISTAPDRSITVVDGIPPTVSLAAYEPATGIIRITFSEPLGPVITYSGMVLAGESGSVALDDVPARAHSAETITATLNAAQRTAVGNTMTLSVSEGAVADAAGNGILQATVTVAANDGIPPALVSSSYNTGTGILVITFSEPLNGTAIHYGRMAVRDAGQSSGGLILDSVTSRTLDADSATTMTLPLSTAQRQMINGMATPQLDIGADAITDIAGSGILAAPDRDITVVDGIPPTVSLASYEPGTGIIRITFSEPLGPVITYSGMVLAGESGSVALDDVPARAHSAETITATLNAAQRTAVGNTMTLSVSEGAVADAAGNGILQATVTVAVTDGILPALVYSSYNTGTGILVITFSEPLGPTIHYDRITVRDVGQSSGGLALDDVATRAVDSSSATMALSLSAAQRQTVSGMASPQLDIGAGAITDTAGNGILAAPDRSITIIDGIPPTVVSAAYNTGTGILSITFSEPLGPVITYSGLRVVGPAGSVALDDVASKSHSDRTITATLDAAQRSTAGDSPTLSVSGGAVADVSGNPASPASNLQITVETPPVPIIPIAPPSNSPPAPPTNRAPTADAGDSQTVTEGAVVSLDGTRSSDAEDTSLTYSWEHTGGPTVTLTGASTATPSFAAPNVGQTRDIVLTLTVTDSGSLTGTDTVTITVNDVPNSAPSVDAGSPQTVTEGTTVSLNGTASDTDPEDNLTYAWTFNNTSLGITLSGPSAPDTSFDAPNVAADTPVLFTLTVSDGTASSTDTVLVTIQDSANTPPTADAGSPQTVTEGTTVSLNGTASDTDPEDNLTYAWTFNNTSLGITLSGPSAPDTSFDAPNVAADTPVLFTLTVSDGTASSTDTVLVTIQDSANTPPTADAGSPQTVTEGTTVSLNGTASDTDPEDNLTYAWTFNNTSLGITLSGPSAPDTSFDAPNVAADTPVLFTLTVSDGTASSTDTVLVTIQDSANTPPTVDAGSPQTVTEGTTVSLNGTASDTDPEDNLTYAWTFNNTSLGITLSGPSAPDTSFDAPNVAADTPVLFTLTVSDGTASSTDTVLVTIQDSANTPPTVDAGSPQTVTEGTTVSLNGTASDTDPEDNLTYAWTFNNTSLGITLSGPSAPDTSFDAPNVAADTPVLFTLTVSDGTASSTDTVLVTIQDSANTPPTADAGSPQTVTEGTTVSLNGTASDTDPEDNLTYAWTFNNTSLGITLSGPSAPDTSFDAPNVAADTPVLFTLTVSDGTASSTDTVLVTIQDSANTPPTADAGSPQTVTEGTTVSLNGTASDTDPEDNLTYAWTFNNTSLGITLSGPSAPDTSFDAPNVAADTPVLFTLTVSDGTASSTDTVLVTIQDSANTPPTVDAGSPQTVTEGTTVSLNGTASDTDPEDNLTYAWTFNNTSLGITLSGPSAPDTSFDAPNVAADTPVLFTLTVSDGTASSTDTVLVTIQDSANTPPTVDAGANRTVTEGDTVSLSGTANDADPEDTLAYKWTHNSSLTITLQNSATLTTTFTAPAVSANTTVLFTLNVTDGTVHVTDTVTITIADRPNRAPTANAGANQTVTEGATVSLNGTLSSDPEDTSLTYSWTHTSGPAVTLTDPATATPSFTAPNVGETRDIVLTLTVTDSGTLTGTDTVTITVNDVPNSAPTVNAGANRTVTEGDTVSLNGTASDADPEDTLVYRWTHNSSLTISLADPSAPDTSFDAPNVAADTPVLFTLTVSDGTASSTDTVLVTIQDSANTPPTADAGANRTVTEGDTVSLNGTASDTDPEDNLTYAWTLNNTALGITLSSPSAPDTSFDAPNVAADTPVLFTLTVSDGTASSTDTVLVTIQDSANTPPTADAGSNQTVTEGATVMLSGTASDDDPEDTSLTYSWTHTSGPAVTLTGSATATPSFTAPNVGETRDIVLTLTVTDSGSLTGTDTVTITVNDSPNSPPTANAGANQTVTEGATVMLSGTASDADTEDNLTYAWTLNNTALGITLSSPSAPNTSFDAPNVAADTPVLFTLTVSDGTASSTDTVLVTIQDSANTPPTVDAGANRTVTEGDTVSLSGTANDADPEDTLAYRWTHNSSLAIALQNSATLTTTFTAPAVSTNTTVLFTLNVTDGTVHVADTVTITIADRPNRAPTADAGENQTVTEGATVSLNGTLSSDPEDTSLTYSWTHTSGPTVTLTDSATATPSFTAPNVGETQDIVITLTVTDSGTLTDTDTVTITVNDVPNSAPSVDAGSPQTVTEGDAVTLSGTASDVDSEDTLAHQWTHNATFTITLQNSTALTTTFTAPAVSANTTVLFTLNVTDGTVHVADTVTITIADRPNRAPTANAGANQTVTEGATVSLNGTASDDDPEDTSLTYSWAHTSGPAISLTDPATATPSFTAPNVGETQDIVLTLTVTDSGSLTDTDTVTITVNDSPNSPPTANAGANQTVTEGATVSLNGTASDDDPEDTSLTYSWAHTSGPAISLTDPATATPSFTAPNVGETQDIVLTLTVTDSGTLTGTDTVTITVNDSPNTPPTANAGANQTVTEGATVSLNGTASDDDPEDTTLTYSWTHTSGPMVTLTDPATATPSFTAPNVGETQDIVLTLTVTDSGTLTDTDTVTITVNDSPNTPPTANAGANQTVTEGATVSLNGTASDDDPEDTTLTYSWTHTSGPMVTLTDPATATPSFTAPNVGETQDIVLTLTVTDSGTLTDTDTVTITVNDSPNTPPTANAGANQTVTEGATVSLNGTASDDDPEDTTLTYSWAHTSGPTISLTDPATATPSFTAPNVGQTQDIVLTLTVTDSGSLTGTDTVTITVNDVPNSAPSVDAGSPQTVTEGDAVTLSGTASDVDSEDTLAHQWTHNATFTITLQNSTALTTTFTAPAVSANTTVLFTLNVTDGTVHVADTVTITIADRPNRAPTANAGANQTVTEGATVSLNGTLSSDPEDTLLTYSWTHTSGPMVTLTDPATATPSFTAPNVGETQDIVLTLTVTDSGTLTDTDTVTITVNDVPNSAPTVNAGANRTVTEGDTVSLNGTASDADPEDTLVYRWTHNSSLTISLADPSAPDTSFDAPNVAADTPVLFTLTVSDGTASSTDTVLVTIQDSANTPPTADAGSPQTVTEGDAVTLSGTANDADPEDTLAYKWTHNSSLTITLADAAALETTFTAPAVSANTTVLFTLNVTDGTVHVTDTVTITIADRPNRAPTANAGANQTVTEGATVSLNGTLSSDPEDTSLTYSWTHTSGPAVTLTDPATATPSFTAPNVGETRDIVLTLTVTDSGTLTGTDTVTITVNDVPNSAPTVNAGANRTVTEGDTVSLNGTASDADPEDTLVYRWTHNSSLTISLADPSAPDTSFDAPNVAADTPVLFTLTVSDGTASSTDTVLVTIQDSANTPPTADAGANRTVTEGDTVSLNGTASDTDPEDNLTYAWTLNNTALGITLSSPSAPDTSFDAPNVAADTPVLFTLTVSDGTASSTDTVLVTIQDSANTPPTADAGSNQTVTEGATVMLSGTASDDDPEDTSLTYSWTHTSGPAVTLTGSATATPSFTAPNVGETRDIVLTLTVTDSGSLTGTDTVTITVNDSPNSPPTANAGANQTVTEGATVMLSGTASDADTEDNLTYAWTLNNTALGITLSSPSAPNTSFDAPNVAADTPVLFTLTVSDGTASSTDTVLVTIQDSANTPPTVDAGANRTVTEGDTVSLSGTANDADPEDTLAYRWTHNSSLAIALQNSATLTTTFTAPAVSTNTTVLFTLNVTDGTVHVADTVTITIADRPNRAPTADAGENQTVTEGATVSLNGTLSSDPEDTSLTYSWTHTSGPTVTLTDSATATPSFTAPNVGETQDIVITLTVTDSGTLTDTDTVTITVNDVPNSAPSVDAGSPQTVTEGTTVMLSGTASDADTEDTLSYEWTHNSSLTITLSSPSAPDTSFDAPNVAADTPVLFTLTVSDGTASSTDTVLVTIQDSANTPPTADASSPQTVTEGDAVTLSGTANDADPEDTLAYKWTHNSSLTITLADAAALETTFTAPAVSANTTVLFTLNVTDGTVHVADTVTITIADRPNRAPTANAGANRTVTEGATVTLSGTASDDDPEDTSLSYSWAHTSGPAISLTGPATATPSFTAPNVGETRDIVLTLTVTDSGSLTDTDTVTITVNDSPNSPPTANAGANRTVAEGTTVSLNGTASDADPEDTLVYRWTHNSSLTISLADPSALDTTLDAPNVAADTPVLFTLTVSDGTASSTDTVLVTIQDSANTPPTVDAGANRTVTEGDTVSLSGTTNDADPEDTLAYQWTHNSSLTIPLQNSATPTTTFTAPAVSANTTVLFTLNVTDGTVHAADTVTITIADRPNRAPTADAGENQTVTEGATVSLNGTLSSDPEDTSLTYSWTHTSGPTVTLTGPATATPSFTAPNVGQTQDIVLTLTVTDSGSLTDTDTVTITVNDVPNSAPSVDAGSPQTVTEGTTVSLNGTASDGDPEDSPTYAWTFNNTSLGITLSSPSAPDTSFDAPNVAADTPVLFTLTVSDGTASSTDTVLVTIQDSANTPPTVDAGSPQTVTEGTTVSLNGTASDTDPEDNLTYAWTFNNTSLGITLSSPSAPDTSFDAPNVAADTPVLFTLTVSDGTASSTDTVLVTIQDSANTPPTANAGANRTVTEGATVTLSGTASDDDPEDTSLSYSWAHTSGPAISLTGPATATPSFTAPNVGETRDIVLTLTVTDSGSLTDTDTVTITVNDSPNSPPTANAGANRTVTEGATVTLSGTASDDDPEDTSLSYSWAHTSGPAISLTGPATATPSFTAPNVGETRDIVLTLTVTDSGSLTDTDTVTITVNDSPNSPPTANAGANRTVTEGATVTLSGTASDDDPEDTSLSYSWAHTSGPAISLTGPATATPSFTAPNVGETRDIVLTLTVTDSGSLTDTDTVTITVNDSPNSPPTANAGANRTVTEGATVTLSGTASDDDPEDTSLSYSWAHTSGPAISLTGPATATPSFTAPNVGETRDIVLTLTVTDSGSLTDTDTVTITVNDSPNSPPTANAGANRTVTEGATVSLNGTASDDDPEDNLTYAWTFNNTSLGITLSSPSAPDTSFDAPNVAADTPVLFTLTVSDGTASSTDTALVTIQDSANTPPTVDAGANRTVTEGDTVSLSGTANDADPEDTLAYQWTHNSSLTISLQNSATPTTTFTAPAVSANTTVLFTLNVTDGTVHVADTVTITIADRPNRAPTANAGANQTVTEGAPVSLNGTLSSDPEDAADSLSYSWTHTSGPAVTLTDSTTATPSFTAPNVGQTQDIVLTLTVTDSGSLTDTDTVTIAVNDVPNSAPTVNAGANRTVTEGDTVSLNGTASDDDPEDNLTYAWTLNNTSPDITLSSPSALDTTFDAPNVAADTPVLFTLTVSDGTASSTDTVLVTIQDSANTPPTVDAGANQNVTEGDMVSLDGTASDTDTEDTLTYAWTFNNTALGITLADASALDTTFDAPNVAADTPVLFTLTVSDGTVSRTDTALVTIQDSANTPPTVNAGVNQNVTEGDMVSLDGTASDTDTEDTLTYAWTFNNTALGITLADASALDTTFDAPNVAADTPVLFTLTVSDGTVSRTDTALVTIQDSANTPPTVNAGVNQNVTEGDMVSLDGTASDTDTEDTLTYAWTFNNTALGITLADASALDTTFDAPNVAADTPVLFTLTVSDGTVSRTDTALVTIQDSANTPPTVNAGVNQNVTEGDMVSLDGTASDDDTEDTLTYAWTFNNTALGITLADASALDTTFDAPNVAADTPVLFTLTVSDGTVSRTDTALVTIQDSANTPPTVNAGVNQNVTEGDMVSLDGTASDDDTEDTLTYAWTFNNTALGITLADASALDTTFDAPNVAADTPVLFTLTVSDGTVSRTDTALVTIQDSANTPPTVNAGVNQNVTEGDMVSLDGTASDDDTEDTLTYAWTFNNTALGITLADASALDTTFDAPNVAADTPVLFTLTVSDGTASSTDTALVTIQDSANSPPTVDAGANQTVAEGDTVTLSGTTNDADPEDTLAYQWTHNSSLTIPLQNSTALSTTFEAPAVSANTTVLFTLNVTDGTAHTTDTVIIVIGDDAPPALLLASYTTGTGVLDIAFSKPLGPTITYSGIKLAGENGNVTLDAVTSKSHSTDTITATLDAAQRTTVGDAITLTVSAGAVSDIAGNDIAQATVPVTVTDGIPPTLASSQYNTGSGILSMIFSEPLNEAAIRYDRLHVRDAGQSSGGLSLGDVPTRAVDLSSTTITLTLSDGQRQTLNDMVTPQLDIGAGAVADTAGNGIAAAPDQRITIPPILVSSYYNIDTGILNITFSKPLNHTVTDYSGLIISGQTGNVTLDQVATRTAAGSAIWTALNAAQMETAGTAPTLIIREGAVADITGNGIAGTAGTIGVTMLGSPLIEFRPIANIPDTTSIVLRGATGVDLFEVGGRTYAVVAAFSDNGIQIIDLTDPANPSAVSSATDGRDGLDELAGATDVATFTIAGRTYAVVAAFSDNGIQIIDLTDPARPSAVASLSDTANTKLAGADGVATFAIAGRTYAVVSASTDDAVQVINLTDPANPSAVSSATDGKDGFDELNGASGMATFTIAGRTYAVVAANSDHGIQIIDLTDPANPSAVSSATHGRDGFDKLAGATDVATFTIAGRTYAVVTANFIGAIQIIDLTDPANPSAVSSATDKKDGFDELNGASGMATFTIAGRTYAVVAANFDDGVQAINLTDPANPSAVSSATDGKDGFDKLAGATDVATFTIAGRTYAVVTAPNDNGIQIVRFLTEAEIPPDLASAVYNTSTGSLNITFSEPLNGPAIRYDRLHVRDAGQSSGGLALDDVGTKAVNPSSMTITLTLSDAQRITVNGMATPQLDIEEGAVADPSGNEIAAAPDQPITTTNGIPPTLASSHYNTGTGILNITFSEPLNGTAINYDRMAVRDAGQSSGGLALDDVGTKAVNPSSTTITLTLSDAQRITVNGMATPQLDIEEGAVADPSGDGIAAAPDQGITTTDGIPPTLTSSHYNTGTGILNITFSEPLNGMAISYDRIAVRAANQSSGGLALDEVTTKALNANSITITLTLSDAQRMTVNGMATPQLDIEEGAVADPSGNGIAAAPDQGITTTDGIPPTLTSSHYNTGTGILNITFSEPLNGTAISYDRIAVRDAGESSGGLALNAVASKTLDSSSTTITLTLSTVQRQTVNDMITPQLDIEEGAVADPTGNGIAAASDQPITVTDITPPTLTSSHYNTGTGILNITFSEPLNGMAISYDRIAVRAANQSSGGLALDEVTTKARECQLHPRP